MGIYIKTNNCCGSGGLVAINGVDKDKFEEFIPVKAEEGTLERFRATADGALLGRDFLEKYAGEYPWKVGQSYKLEELGGVSITFVGSFESDSEVFNTVILTGRRFIQEVDDSLGVSHQVFVKIDDPENAAKVIDDLDRTIAEEFPYKTVTRDQRSFITAGVSDLREIIAFSHVIMLVTLLVVMVSVANTVSMATRDRVQEFGIIRSVGFRRLQIIGLVTGESVILGVAGGALGLMVAYLVLSGQDGYYALSGLNLTLDVTPQIALRALLVSAGVGILGGIPPALGVSRLSIVSSLRNVD